MELVLVLQLILLFAVVAVFAMALGGDAPKASGAERFAGIVKDPGAKVE